MQEELLKFSNRIGFLHSSRSMPTFSNAGGSLGSAIILTLLAWGVRWARSELGRRKQPDSSDAAPGCVSPFHARVSVKTLFGLLETRACKFLLVDVRPFTEADFVDGALGVGEGGGAGFGGA